MVKILASVRGGSDGDECMAVNCPRANVLGGTESEAGRASVCSEDVYERALDLVTVVTRRRMAHARPRDRGVHRRRGRVIGLWPYMMLGTKTVFRYFRLLSLK